MDLRHGIWSRLGLTLLSGIVAASFAPAAVAAPADGQGAHGDTEPTVVEPSAAADGEASANPAGSAEDATASSEENGDEAGADGTYSFPGVSGPTKIHVIATGSADAILLESRGVFAMIDGAEGKGAPDGKDPRYPLRPGTTPASVGDTEWVLEYMTKHGVTSSNLAFYLGTHAHSDHIDNADDIIRKFRPKVIFSPEYSDKWITNPAGLWDNQWCYDNMVDAAKWAQKTYGAKFVQEVDGYNTHVQLGDMDVQLIPFDPEENYKVDGTTDANLMGWGAKATAFGSSAFLAADLMGTEADWNIHNDVEDRVARVVGRVDMLKAGHHGLRSSNFDPFMETLRPSMIIQTGAEWFTPDNLTKNVIHGDVSWAPMIELWDNGRVPSVIATFDPAGISYNDFSAASWGHEYDKESPRAWWFKGGRPAARTGWWKGRSGSWYYFAGKPSSETAKWISDSGQWYWVDATGAMASSEWINDGKGLYYVDSAGNPSGNGWTWIDGAWYYLSNGRARLGWAWIDGAWYYLDAATGAMGTGWTQIGGSRYFLGSSGAMATGWTQIDGAWYYLGTSGAMATGWLREQGSWYFLGASGAMATGWFQDGTSWYYAAASGAMATGWAHIGGSWYYFGTSGAMATGWARIGGSWYYFGTSGAMVTGWFEDGGKWYYAENSGAMVTGWLQSGSTWYYFSSSGAMSTGWVLIDGSWYYFDARGAMVTGTQTISGRVSIFAPSGRWLGYAS